MKSSQTIVFTSASLALILLFSPLIGSQWCDKYAPERNDYELLIITSKLFEPYCYQLIEHKSNLGIDTIIITIDKIYSNHTGIDKQEQIKNCIKETYDQYQISSVLLIGDLNIIPVRYCFNDDGYSMMEPCFVSDLYYADIYDENQQFSTWDTDKDNYFGEWNKDTADDYNISLKPEIAIGRLPCSNRLEVKAMIQKIILYETSEKSDWFHRIVVAGGDTYSDARGYSDIKYKSYEGEEITKNALSIMDGFSPTSLWASDKTLTSLSLVREINKGCGFLFLSGHGNPATWTTHPPNSSKKVGTLPSWILPLFHNREQLPICIIGACQVSRIDVSPYRLLYERFLHDTWRLDCFSWKLTKNPFGGAIATIGCTGLSWQGIEFGGGGADWLNLQFFREYKDGATTLGTIWQQTINKYLEAFPIDWDTPSGETSSIDAKTVQEWMLIGDPTLRIEV